MIRNFLFAGVIYNAMLHLCINVWCWIIIHFSLISPFLVSIIVKTALFTKEYLFAIWLCQNLFMQYLLYIRNHSKWMQSKDTQPNIWRTQSGHPPCIQQVINKQYPPDKDSFMKRKISIIVSIILPTYIGVIDVNITPTIFNNIINNIRYL